MLIKKQIEKDDIISKEKENDKTQNIIDEIIDVVTVDETMENPTNLKDLKLWDYMQTVKPIKMSVNERHFYEKTFRSFLLSQLNTELNDYEKVALNQENVKERADKYEILSTENCLACQIINQNPQAGVRNECRKNESKLIYPIVENQSSFKVVIPIRNPLFKHYVSRYPDLRLSSSNIERLRKKINARSLRRKQKDPVAVHICQKRYGILVKSAKKNENSYGQVSVPSLFFYQSIPSKSSFEQSSEDIEWSLKRKYHGRFNRYWGRSTSEPPTYSKHSTLSSFGKIRPKLSRSLSPIKRTKNKYKQEEIYEIPHNGKLKSSLTGETRDELKDMICTKINGIYITAFSSAQYEKSIFMVKKPKECVSNFKFQRFNIEYNYFVFPCFNFTMIEENPMEYLLRLRYGNSNPLKFILPTSKIGSIMPFRAIYDYLRLFRRIPLAITWKKKLLKIPDGIRSNMNLNKTVTFNVVDVFKYLGLFCITPRKSNQYYAALGCYREFINGNANDFKRLYKKGFLNINDLLLATTNPVYDGESEEWKTKCIRINGTIQNNSKLTKNELMILRMTVSVMNKKEGSIPLVRIDSRLNFDDIITINQALVEYYYKFQGIKCCFNSDDDSTCNESELDVICTVESSIDYIKKPIKIKEENYYLGDYEKVIMHDPANNDISKIVPNSRYLYDKKHLTVNKQKKNFSTLYERRIKRKWDESDDEDDIRSKRRSSRTTTPSDELSTIPDFDSIASPNIDFDAMSMCSNKASIITVDTVKNQKKVIFIGDDLVKPCNSTVDLFGVNDIKKEEKIEFEEDIEEEEEEDDDDWEIRKKKREEEALAELIGESDLKNIL